MTHISPVMFFKSHVIGGEPIAINLSEILHLLDRHFGPKRLGFAEK